MAISLAVKIFGDIDGLLTSLKKAEKAMNAFSRKVGRAGDELTKSLTLPIVGLGFVAVKNFGEAEKALVSLEAALRANGKDVQAVSADYQKFTQEIQNLTTVDDDAAIGLLQLAESMQALDAKKATQDAIGLSKAFGIDLQSAIKMVVQAQNGVYTMLGRYLPAIRSAKTETEKAAIANKAFADGFEIAKNQAKAGLGPLEQMKNKVLDLSEAFGKIIVEAITPIVNGLKKLAEWMDTLTETQRKWVVGIGLTLAAIGPLLIIIAKIPAVIMSIVGVITILIPMFRALTAVMMANPWLALAAAIGLATAALINYFNTKNKEGKKDLAQSEGIKKAVEEYTFADIAGRKKIIKLLKDEIRITNELYMRAATTGKSDEAEAYKKLLDESESKLKALNRIPPPMIPPPAISSINEANEKLTKTKSHFEESYLFIKGMSSGLVSVGMELKKIASLPITTSLAKLQTNLTPDAGITKPGTNMIPGALDIDPVLNNVDKVKEAFAGISTAVGGIYTRTQDVFNSIADFVGEAANGFANKWTSAVQKVLEVMSSVMSMISEIVTSSHQRRLSELDEYYDKERNRIRGSTMSEEQKNKTLEKLDKTAEKKRKELLREQAKDQKTVAIISAIINGALAVVMALTGSPPPGNFIFAAIVGALAAVQIALIASQPLPALAQGGLAYAPAMAMVGDNPNARIDPEVISPLSKLRAIMSGGQSVEVYGVLRGDDILISSERASDSRLRTRGY